MTGEITYRNVQLFYDREHGPACEGWYTRHDEYVSDAHVEEGKTERLLKGACEHPLDCDDPDNVAAALDEAVALFGGKVKIEEIEVVPQIDPQREGVDTPTMKMREMETESDHKRIWPGDR